jgi:hypothetical protein
MIKTRKNKKEPQCFIDNSQRAVVQAKKEKCMLIEAGDHGGLWTKAE